MLLIKNLESKTRDEVFDDVELYINSINLKIKNIDKSRPWGGFFAIEENDAEKFISKFFEEINSSKLNIFSKLSPKFLIVEQNKRLSWQYHKRRAEIWKLIAGNAKIARNVHDAETQPIDLELNKIIELECGERHRLIGPEKGWGIVAEIWQHTDKNHPSDEQDIIRLQDDFLRN